MKKFNPWKNTFELYKENFRNLKFNLSWLFNRTLYSEVLTVSLTKKCNLNCVYCWDYDNRPQLKEMSTDDIKKLIDQAAKMGVETFNPFGGEPFLRRDAIDIIGHAFKRGMKVTVTTNGTLLSREHCRQLVEVADNGRLIVLVSLDGATAEENDRVRNPGSFEKTCRTINNLCLERERQKKGIPIIVNSVISRNNFRSMEDQIRLTRHLNADLIHFITPVVSSDDVSRGMIEGDYIIMPEDFAELDQIIDSIAHNKEYTKSILLNNKESLLNFKDYYRRQYEQHRERMEHAKLEEASGEGPLCLETQMS